MHGVHFGVATRSACRWSVAYSRHDLRNLFRAGSLFDRSSQSEGRRSAPAEVSLLRLVGGHLHPAFYVALLGSTNPRSSRGPHGEAGAGLPFHQQTPPQRALGCLPLFGVPVRSAVPFAQFAARR